MLLLLTVMIPLTTDSSINVQQNLAHLLLLLLLPASAASVVAVVAVALLLLVLLLFVHHGNSYNCDTGSSSQLLVRSQEPNNTSR